MTRQHFNLIAETLRELEAEETTINAFANALRYTNGNFDRGRFITASQREV